MKPKKISGAEQTHESPIVGARLVRVQGRGQATPLLVPEPTVVGARLARARSIRGRAPGTPLQKSPAVAPAAKIILRLFVAGTTARSQQAILRVREFCRGEPRDTCELEVIDIYQQPKLARDHQIVATPTLIKEFPRPVRRFIGNLLNTAGLHLELNLVPKVA